MARFDELLELSNWVFELYPDCSNAYDIKSWVYIKKGDFKSALEFNEYALYYDSENSVAKERKEHILKKLAEEWFYFFWSIIVDINILFYLININFFNF